MSYRIIDVNSLIIVDCWTGCLDRYYQRQLLYIRDRKTSAVSMQ